LRDNGSFGNPHAAASLQPSASTTTNNTDTSGATTLQAAPDAEARQALENWNEEAQLNAGKGLASAPVTASSYSANKGATDSPHGKNITEGRFDGSAPNASFNGDIGGRNDPGRKALGDMQRNALQAAGDAGGPRQQGVTDDGQFDVLGDTSA
jgi:hypothetical protein